MDLGKLSEHLFGRPMRLPLLLWIRARGDSPFFISEVQKATGYTHGHVKKELGTFVELGFLGRTQHPKERPKILSPRTLLLTLGTPGCS